MRRLVVVCFSDDIDIDIEEDSESVLVREVEAILSP